MTCVSSLAIRPSRMSLSVNLSRTHKPSVRGREVKVFRPVLGASLKSSTKSALLTWARSIRTTLPEGFSNSSLPSTTNLAGETYPLRESRPVLRTMTFLWVEAMAEIDSRTDYGGIKGDTRVLYVVG